MTYSVMRVFVFTFISLVFVQACEPEIGSKSWCEKMDAKAKGDWTANDAKDYAKHCLFD